MDTTSKICERTYVVVEQSVRYEITLHTNYMVIDIYHYDRDFGTKIRISELRIGFEDIETVVTTMSLERCCFSLQMVEGSNFSTTFSLNYDPIHYKVLHDLHTMVLISIEQAKRLK